jgi:peptide-methionine (R)-S-oxide reductase
MPRHRQFFWAGLSTVAMLLWMVSMAAAQDPSQQVPQDQGSSAQDPFDAAAKAGSGASAKGSTGAAGNSAEKAADQKSTKKPEPEFVHKTLLEWQRTLPRGVFEVTRLKATESPFTGKYATGHFSGTFLCACCDAELFSSQAKFDSGTGWPSFWQPVKARAIDRAMDNSEAEPRIEVMCHRCGAHLGHVFDDGPPPTGLRYCINSLSLKLKSNEGETARPASTKAGAKSQVKTTRSRSKAAMRSSRAKGTAKATEPASTEPANATPGGSETPATGKPDGNGQ